MHMMSKMHNFDLCWYAVYTRSRAEFSLEKELTGSGVHVYLPTIKRLRQWKDRKKWVAFPLFPSYIFVHTHPLQREFSKVILAKNVVRILGSSSDGPEAIPQEQMVNLMKIAVDSPEIKVDQNLKAGMRVRIKNGPLEGTEGIIERPPSANRCTFYVNIEILGRSVGVEIPSDSLEIFQ